MVAFANFGLLFLVRTGLRVDQLERQKVVALSRRIAIGRAAGQRCVQQVIDRLPFTLKDRREQLHIARNEQGVGAKSCFDQGCIDHSAADRLEFVGSIDPAVDQLVNLIFEVAQFFGTFVLNADEAYFARCHDPVPIRSGGWNRLRRSEQPSYRFFDQRIVNLRTRRMATDQVRFIVGYQMTVAITAAAESHRENDREGGEPNQWTLPPIPNFSNHP